MSMVHEQIKLAAKSLENRRKFESGWYEKRIEELEAQVAEANTTISDQNINVTHHQKENQKLKAQLGEFERSRRDWKQQAIGNQMCNMCNYLERDLCLQRFEELEAENVELQRAAKLLAALEAAGVDNWEWYGEATREFYAEEKM